MKWLKVLGVLLPLAALALAALVSMETIKSQAAIKWVLWGAAMCSAAGPFLPRLKEALDDGPMALPPPPKETP